MAKKAKTKTTKKEIKFTQEELQSLQQINDSYFQVKSGLGELEVSRIQTEQKMEQIDGQKLRLEAQWVETTRAEQDMVNRLNEKYGPGTVNPETGVFTPIK
tara:strand:- start:678 stop:980 length:303 start_codon:yes stop_codon:yes gene_type:complete